MSSAYSRALTGSWGFGKSYSMMLKSVGLRGEPCGTPASRSRGSDAVWPIRTRKDLLCRKFVSRMRHESSTPISLSLRMSPGIQVESDALARSNSFDIGILCSCRLQSTSMLVMWWSPYWAPNSNLLMAQRDVGPLSTFYWVSNKQTLMWRNVM